MLKCQGCGCELARDGESLEAAMVDDYRLLCQECFARVPWQTLHLGSFTLDEAGRCHPDAENATFRREQYLALRVLRQRVEDGQLLDDQESYEQGYWRMLRIFHEKEMREWQALSTQ